jgi:integrase
MNNNTTYKSAHALSAMAKGFLAFKKTLGAGRAYLALLRHSLRLLIERLGDIPITNVTSGAIHQVIASSRSPDTVRQRLHIYRSFFAWVYRRGYLQRDPMRGLRLPPPPWRQLAMPYTADEVRRILGALTNPDDVGAVALAAFAGLRATELTRLRREDIGGERIVVRPDNAACFRYVPVLPVLQLWLMPLLQNSEFFAKGPLPLLVIARRVKALGLTVAFRRLRLSFIAARYAATGDISRTAAEAGVTPTMYRHILCPYREEARKFWALTPDACGHPDWEETVCEHLKAHTTAKKSCRGKRLPVSGAQSKGKQGGRSRPKE